MQQVIWPACSKVDEMEIICLKHLRMDYGGCRCPPVKYKKNTASKYGSEMGRQFWPWNIQRWQATVCATPAPYLVAIAPYPEHKGALYIEEALLGEPVSCARPLGQERVPSTSPNTCSDLRRLWHNPKGLAEHTALFLSLTVLSVTSS